MVRPGHYEFIEPTKRYADIIIPEGGANERALTVYRRLGFEPIDQRTQHYPEGLIVEQLIMECDLNRFPA